MIDMNACRTFCERRQLAHMLSSQPIDIDRPTPVLRYHPARADTRPAALTRDPCPRCQTRGDIGCAHQRPYTALASPVEPGQREGRRRYDRRTFGVGA